MRDPEAVGTPGVRRPIGTITRGTTGPNRLRRCDRWLTGPQGWRLRLGEHPPVVVDLGYGRTPVTARELHDRLIVVRPDVQVMGVEIDPERVAQAAPLTRPGLSFIRGGFEVPTPGHVRIIRAFNVLRQYDESQVEAAWARMRGRLDPDGVVVEGTCDELGRVASWVTLDREGPLSFTVSLRLAGLSTPAIVAERLPKALIHRNVPGERVHGYLAALSAAWERASAYSAYGPRQRFKATAQAMQDSGWSVQSEPRRWRLGELTVDWAAVCPE